MNQQNILSEQEKYLDEIKLNEEINKLKKQINELEKELNQEKNKNKLLEENIIILKNKLDEKKNNEKDLIKSIEMKNVNINDLKKIIVEKEKNINILETKLKRFPFELNKEEKLMSVIFTTLDQKFYYSIICKNNDRFNTIENKLYEAFSEYSGTDNFFIVNGSRINEMKTLEENKIKNNDIIILNQL